MRSASNFALRIGVSRIGIALLRTSGWLRRRTEWLAQAPLAEPDAASPAWLAARLDEALAGANCAGLRTSVVVDNAWARLFMVTPPVNATRWHDCRAAAELRLHALYGAGTDDWQIEADWDARQPFLACALPRPLLAALRAATDKHRLRLLSVAPQFITAWNQWHPVLAPASWFGVAHAGALMVGAIDQRRLCAVRSLAVPADARQHGQWLADQLARDALRMNLPAPARIQLCGDVPRDWLRQAAGAPAVARLGRGASSKRPHTPASQLALTGVDG